MTITIESKNGESSYDVRCGDQLAEGCGFDEALGVVAALFLGAKPRYMKFVPVLPESPPVIDAEPDPANWKYPKLNWQWAGGGQWVATGSIGVDVYRIEQLAGGFFVFSPGSKAAHDYPFASRVLAEEWCERVDLNDIPF